LAQNIVLAAVAVGSQWVIVNPKWPNKPRAEIVNANSQISKDVISDNGYVIGTGHAAGNNTDRVNLGSIAASNPLNCNANNQVTVATYMDLQGTGQGYPRIIDKSNGGTAANGWALYLGTSSGTNRIPRFAAAGGNGVDCQSAIALGEHFVSASYNASTSSSGNVFVVDGTSLGATGHSTRTIPTTVTNAAIGNWNHNAGTDRPFDGALYMMLVWNKVFTITEHQKDIHPTMKRWGLFEEYGRTFYSLPTAAGGSIVVTPGIASAIGSAEDPTVVLGSTSASPDNANAVGSAQIAAVIQGALSLTPDNASAVGSAQDPSVVLGAVSVTPDNANAVGSSQIGGVEQSSLAISPDNANAAGTALIGNVEEGGIIVDLGSDPASAAGTANIGGVVLGNVSVDLSGDEASATGSAQIGNVVGGANVTVSPEAASAAGTAHRGAALGGLPDGVDVVHSSTTSTMNVRRGGR
jgi:hypothetical protein